MPIDRAATLRNAEKLIRQGKLDAAIAEYERLLEDQPRDWNLANALGDLYLRAGQNEKAIDRFLEIADSLNDEGATAKAGAVYKKILKIQPDHERTLVHVSEVLGNQGRYADARTHLNALIELRRGRGDTRGVLQATVRLGSLDPDDYDARLTAANARIEMGDKAGALSDLKEIGSELAGKGRTAEAIGVLQNAAKLNADDEEVQEKLLEVHVATGDLAKARECASTIEQFRTIAAAYEAQNHPDEALNTLCQAAQRHPLATELNAELARTFVGRGDPARAAEYLTPETAGDDPALLMVLADIQLRGEKVDDGLALVRRLIEEDPSRREQIALMGWTVGERQPDVGFRVVELAADAAVAQSDWPGAAAALQEFVTRVPNHIPALMRLVEICVDGGLESTMYSAQAQLADAYITAGAATEARFIAEDLVAREPWDKANIERFRRALVLLGEPDPDALIAARLSGESPFTSTDLLADGSTVSVFDPPGANAQPAEAESSVNVEELLAAAREAELPPAKKPRKSRRREEEHHFELSANAIDLESILGDLEPPPEQAPAASSEDVEIDLSVVLDDAVPDAPPAPIVHSPGSADLDSVFERLRGEATRRVDTTADDYQRGVALLKAGDTDAAVEALTAALRGPQVRFAAASLLGRTFKSRGMMRDAIEWFERAADAPAPSAADSHRLLYELADALESTGEVARALAICLELQAEAAEFEDIDARVDRLAKVQSRG